ncbi:MAG: hypothetical protein GEV05_15455 [Betaproteobacteria bacterium]|nr:hypothetical protein [Betaproteobacteria bacterium]
MQIERVLREWPAQADSAPEATFLESERATRMEAPPDQESFDRLARDRCWTDGLPLVPPTLPRVETRIAAGGYDRDEVIAHVAPAFGAATIERIAVNAAMAGCPPEAMPVLIAAIEALCDPGFNLQGIQATTNPATACIIVNGPVVERLSFNAGINCLGQGSWANATVGRALRLVMQNIGGARPGEMDRATHGQPGKYSLCCAENEAANPWEPLHVERGYGPGESTVTVIGVSGTLNMNTHAKDADDLLRVLADTIAYPTSNDYWFGGEPWLILSPEHAEILANARLTKAEVKARLWEESKMAASRLSRKDHTRTQHTRRAELGDFAPHTHLPVSTKSEDIGLIVAGGAGTHSVYMPTFGNTRSVTRPIRA